MLQRCYSPLMYTHVIHVMCQLLHILFDHHLMQACAAAHAVQAMPQMMPRSGHGLMPHLRSGLAGA